MRAVVHPSAQRVGGHLSEWRKPARHRPVGTLGAVEKKGNELLVVCKGRLDFEQNPIGTPGVFPALERVEPVGSDQQNDEISGENCFFDLL